jgi:hypothetical protein
VGLRVIIKSDGRIVNSFYKISVVLLPKFDVTVELK